MNKKIILTISLVIIMLSMSACGLTKGSISFREDTENNSESDFDKIEVYNPSDTNC